MRLLRPQSEAEPLLEVQLDSQAQELLCDNPNWAQCDLQEDEEQSVYYTFSPSSQMQAGIDAGLFLESNSVKGPHGTGLFGISFAAIAEAAATGMPSNDISNDTCCASCN